MTNRRQLVRTLLLRQECMGRGCVTGSRSDLSKLIICRDNFEKSFLANHIFPFRHVWKKPWQGQPSNLPQLIKSSNGLSEYRKFKRLSGWSQTSQECACPQEEAVHPLRHIRRPLSERPIGQPKDRLLCMPGCSETAPPKLTESSRLNPPLQLGSKKHRTLQFGQEEKHWMKILPCSKATGSISHKDSNSWAPGFYTTSMTAFWRRRLSAIRKNPSLSRHTILPWFL